MNKTKQKTTTSHSAQRFVNLWKYSYFLEVLEGEEHEKKNEKIKITGRIWNNGEELEKIWNLAFM